MRFTHTIVLALFICGGTMQAFSQAWREASFELLSKNFSTYRTGEYANVFAGKKNSIVSLAPELEGLRGIRLPADEDDLHHAEPLQLKFKEPVQLLIGVCKDSLQKETAFNPLLTVFYPGQSVRAAPVLLNAVAITGIPKVDVYAVAYKKGLHTIPLPTHSRSPFMILGVVKAGQANGQRNAGLPDGRNWDPFLVDGFYDTPLFSVISGPDAPVVDSGMAGTEGILGGFEGGACIKTGDTYHLFPTERAGEAGIEAYYDRVKTRIGHWTSKDALHWQRQSTIYQASGTYAITHHHNPLNERRGAIWSYMPVWSEKANRWYGYYLAYTVDKDISPNHSFGRIWRAESVLPGLDGIGGPYKDMGIIMEPGLDTQLWEGRQGVDSFYPYEVNGKWLGFYGGAYPYQSRAGYPAAMGKGWFVGLAQSATLEGPWKRLDTTVNPVTSIHPWFIENPIVSKLPNGLYIAIFDGGPEGWGHHLPNMMGYSLSKDGIKWSEARYIPFSQKVKKWWTIMRTPLCLIPEGNDEYTVVYAAINTSKRFHPMGMVKLKLNRAALERREKDL